MKPSVSEARVAHERDQRVVDLGDAAAEGRGGEMHDALALERLGELADLVHEPARRDRRVVAQGLVTDVDELEHVVLDGWRQSRLATRFGQELHEPQTR